MKPSTLGKILGALGALALVSSPYTYFITTGSPWLAGAKALVGVALIAFYFATSYGEWGQFASSRATFFVVSTVVLVLVLLAALGAVNYIASRKNKSWDLTAKKIYTLAPQTLSTVKGLKEPVKAIGFLQTSNPNYESLDQLFQRYHAEAPNKFEYVFKDPRKSPDLAAKYQLKEGQATVVLTRGSGDKETHTALNIVSEQELTNALIKINSVGEQKVYFIVGHGEWPLEPAAGTSPEERGASVSELKKTLQQEGYAAEALNLVGKREIPRDAALVAIAGAKSKFTPAEESILKNYLDEGGRLIYFADFKGTPSLDKLLEHYGIQVDPGLVAENTILGDPYDIISTFYADHEITRILKQAQLNVEFPLTRGLNPLRQGIEGGVKAEPVVLTSPYAFEVAEPTEDPKPLSGAKTGQIPLVVASTHSVQSAEKKRFDETRVVAFGTSQILLDVNWGHDPNRNLVMNSIAWGSEQVSRITIRPPDRDISTLDLDLPLLAKIRFVATDLVPISLLGIGLAIWLARQNK